jgi:diacylglycerol kinase family enzyme
MADARRIPAFVNTQSGTADKARDALERVGLFDIHEVPGKELRGEIERAVKAGAPRILIAGGDGSIRTAVEVVAGTGVELAVLPSGTLNHFAKDHRLSTDLNEAAQDAAGPFVMTTDVGRVGEHRFHGTSSIGLYVVFMRTRDKIEKYLGYKLASFVAGIYTLIHMPSISVQVEIEGQKKFFRTPLLFVAVRERELQLPTLGGLRENGQRCLHLMAAKGRKRARFFMVALDAFSNGVRKASRNPELDSYLVQACTISMRHKKVRISFDGEAQTVDIPLEFALERDSLKLVVPDPSRGEEESKAPR